MRRTYPRMTGFVANSQAVREDFCKKDGISPERVAVIFNGLDVDGSVALDRAGPVTDIGVLANVNRHVKRLDLFIEAAGLLAATYPNIRWHVIGDGHLRPGLERRASELGIREKIVFAGRVSDARSYLKLLQIAVSCSDTEGFSNAVLEYMVAGAAVVATAVGGNNEALVHGESGILFPPGDVAALANALRRLVDDEDLRLSLTQCARARVADLFNWDICVERHIELYERSLAAVARMRR